MNYRQPIYTKRWRVAAITALLILPLLLYTQLHFLRPPRTNLEMTLFQGIAYKREAHFTPRPYMLHIVTIDLTAPGIGVFVTPGISNPDQGETIARTTSEFIKAFKLQLAVNANYFHPFHEHSPWNFYPHSGDKVNAVGQAISRGLIYSEAQSKWPVLCFDASNRAQILESGECPPSTVQGVAGKPMVMIRGTPVPESSEEQRPYPRMAAAIDRQGQTLWLIAVDGKQPFYSEGVTLAELSEIALKLGAYTALNLDGGGSTTLVMANRSGVQVLNAAIHTKLPMRQRPVVNHLGFFARLPEN
ncbi:MAG: phosphodiester glycosidase family protein [Coleofasciculus sp. S288]|nr:phosphodiester glycosidase family protein [Coleofasciculus sp. S288]